MKANYKLLLTFFALIIFSTIILGCSDGPKVQSIEPKDELTEAAQPLYQRACMACHGRDLNGGTASGLLNTGLTKDEFLEITLNGDGRRMPGGLVSDESAELITKWIFEMENKQNE
ncbi:cytochrome c [Evansella sp. AB-rgal1]|uniref:c-type cytochrome n=1 Tax=Evansella sp. AB-rgal1 TaxID=3242696 RepID=UPI00359CCAE9